MNDLEAVIFDCDGTLVDSETIGNRVLAEFAREHGVCISDEETLQRFRGKYMVDTVSELGDMRGRPLHDGFIVELRGRMADAFKRELQPIDGARELLEGLAMPYCIASSGPRKKMEVTLHVSGLAKFFPPDRIFSGYEVKSWKPDPGLFEVAAASLGVDPKRCAVVEDSLPGAQAGIAAGMQVFVLQPHAPDPGLPADVTIVSSLFELPPLLGLNSPAQGD